MNFGPQVSNGQPIFLKATGVGSTGAVKLLKVSNASLTSASGKSVLLFTYDKSVTSIKQSLREQNMVNNEVFLIPRENLAPNTVYTAQVSGTIDGAPFAKAWQFTTGDGK